VINRSQDQGPANAEAIDLKATSGPGNPDMIMYTENMFPASRDAAEAFAIAA